MIENIKGWFEYNTYAELSWKIVLTGTLVLLLAVLVGLILGTLGGAWMALQSGDIQARGNLSSFLGSLGTIALVLVTVAYVGTTLSLVKETKEQETIRKVR